MAARSAQSAWTLNASALGWAFALALLIGPAEAQWSIGPPGPRTAPPGENRYIYFVLTNPLAGYEAAFNDVYQNEHMGDLVQFPGWEGAQRFRLVSELSSHPTTQGYRYGYMIIWDKQASAIPNSPVGAAIAGGKSRRIPGFDYSTPGASWQATYKILGPKVRRTDGKGPFMPALSDNVTPRPNRYVLLEFDNVPAGITEAEFVASLDNRIGQVLRVPGWMAAQRAVLEQAQPAGREPVQADKYLTEWEIEGRSAQDAQDALEAATKAGRVSAVSRDMTTAQSSYWLPISPYITKDDFER